MSPSSAPPFARPRAAGVALVLAALAATSVAAADPTAAEKETARSLMDRGHQNRDRGDHAAALESFRAADAIMHVPTTSLEVAREQVSMGQLVEARDTVLAILRTPTKPGEPAVFAQARTSAKAMDADLAARIPSIKVSVSGGREEETPEVRIDGTTLAAAAYGTPFKVNPGTHVVSAITATAEGKIETAVGERESKAVIVPLAARVATAGEVEEAEPAEAVAAPASSGSGMSSTKRILFWGGGGLAVVGLVAGSITGAISLSSTSTARGGCTDLNQCPPSTWNDLDSAHTTATISTISFIAAGVGAAAFAVSFFVPSSTMEAAPASSGPRPMAHARVVPWVGLGSAGLRGTF